MAVDGSYRVKVEMMGNEAEGTVTLRARGATLEGQVEALGMQADLQDGRLSGNTFSGAIEGPTPFGQMRFKVGGTITGERISGTLKSGLVAAKFSGVRLAD